MLGKDDGGLAFACASVHGQQSGQTLRDYFAGQALSGMCASKLTERNCASEVAKMAYMVADAMLKERKRW